MKNMKAKKRSVMVIGALSAILALSATGCSTASDDVVATPVPTTTITVTQAPPTNAEPELTTISPSYDNDNDSDDETTTSSSDDTVTSGQYYNIFTGPNYTDSVVLTFDDCPSSYDQLVSTVTAAEKADIGLVLAPIGDCITKYKNRGQDIVSVMRTHGQYVINHSVSHAALSTLSYSEIIDELSAPGVVTNFGRAPYGDGFFSSDYSQKVADAYKQVGMKAWLWTVDSEDWKNDKPADQVVNYVINNSGKSDTVLMHMNHNAFNPESILAIKHGLNNRGLEVCRAYSSTTPAMLPYSLPC